MRKILLITLVLLLQSVPTLGNELEDKGLLCFNKQGNFKKDILGFYFFKKNYYTYDQYYIKNLTEGQSVLDFRVEDNKTFLKLFKNQMLGGNAIEVRDEYVLTDEFIFIYLKYIPNTQHLKDELIFKINRTTTKVLSKDGEIIRTNCLIYPNFRKLRKELDRISSQLKLKYKQKLEKRKF